MGNSKTIEIQCMGADLLPLDAIEDFQGNLKARGKKEVNLIIKSIETYGFSFPFFIWNGDGHNRCLDGHGRLEALAEMRRRGYSLPTFPVSYIKAKDEAEAKQKLLRLNSQYGKMTVDSVLEFLDGEETAWGDLALPEGILSFESAGGDKEPKMDSDFSYKEQYGVIVICKDEEEQEAVFNEMTEKGFTVRVVKT